ncbi:MAG: HAMP domain-containing protein, partial [Bacteroidota bacterium]
MAIKLALWIGAVGALSLASLLLINDYNIRYILESELEERLGLLTKRQQLIIKEELERDLDQIEAIAEFPDIKRIAQGEEVDMREYKNFLSRYTNIFVVSPDGTFLYGTDVSTWQVGENLKNSTQVSEEVKQLFSITTTTLQRGFSDFHFDAQKQVSTGHVAAPIRSRTGLELGVLIGEIKFEDMSRALEDREALGETGVSLLVVKSNNYLQVLNKTSQTEKVYPKFENTPEAAPIFHEVLKGNSGSGIKKDRAGKKVFAKWTYLPDIRAGLVTQLNVEEAFKSANELRFIFLVAIAAVLLVFTLVMYLVIKVSTSPVRILTQTTKQFASGNLDARVNINSKTEVGDLADAFNSMADTIANNQRILEYKVQERTEELAVTNEELLQNQENTVKLLNYSEKQNADINASIRAAERIQAALLPSRTKLEDFFGDSFFLLYKPRDIVSGDFYWFHEDQSNPNCIWLAVADCTGHGVPGALMSIVGNNTLNNIVNNWIGISPATALQKLDESIVQLLEQDEENSKEGMDIGLCRIDIKYKTLTYAGARHDLCMVEDGKLSRIRGTRRSIREKVTQRTNFTDKTINYEGRNIKFYLYSDGYRDQIDDKTNRKF